MGENLSKILVIEDDSSIFGVLAANLRDTGFLVDHAADGLLGLARALEGSYDLVILDVSLPKLDGHEVCKRLRQERPLLPILMLTAMHHELDRVTGLQLGADDYVTKPFSTLEVLARVRALIRRAKVSTAMAIDAPKGTPGDLPPRIAFGRIVIDLERHCVSVNERELALTASEFHLLTMLALSPGRCFTRDELLAQIWGYTSDTYTTTITTMVSRLRRKLEDTGCQIKTIRGVGYSLVESGED